MDWVYGGGWKISKKNVQLLWHLAYNKPLIFRDEPLHSSIPPSERAKDIIEYLYSLQKNGKIDMSLNLTFYISV